MKNCKILRKTLILLKAMMETEFNAVKVIKSFLIVKAIYQFILYFIGVSH